MTLQAQKYTAKRKKKYRKVFKLSFKRNEGKKTGKLLRFLAAVESSSFFFLLSILNKIIIVRKNEVNLATNVELLIIIRIYVTSKRCSKRIWNEKLNLRNVQNNSKLKLLEELELCF